MEEAKILALAHGFRERERERERETDEEEGLRNEIIRIGECVHTWVKAMLF